MRENIRLFSAPPSDGRFVGRTRRIKIVPNGTRSSLPCLSSLPFPFYHYHHYLLIFHIHNVWHRSWIPNRLEEIQEVSIRECNEGHI